ncbi:MAG TPA: ABC transporter ATP-binding protein [Acidimicrobiales bacterium]|nr:ABC transporter ATP-binding protein [Acidimicrobiales bacterium]
MLEVENLSVSYGAVRALDGVSFTASPGRITAVLGANGAGKTTLLRTISGLVRPQHGRVRLDQKDLTLLAAEDVVRTGVAHVPEGRGVIDELTVEDNLRLGSLWRRDRADNRLALDEVYELFPPLAERRRRAGSTLSGGERQMLAIGRALMSRPRVLLLDEPSLGLAPRITAQIMAMLGELTHGSELTVVLVEQNARSALSVAGWAVVVHLGRIVVQDHSEVIGSDEGLRHHYLGF